MKKITMMLAIACMSLGIFAQSSNWSKTPLMADAVTVSGQARNIAAGVFNGNDRVFAPQVNASGAAVYIFNAATGDYVGLLNSTGLAALGTFKVADGDVTEDGKLLLGNVARNSQTFQVYKWENETDAPELVITYKLPAGPRYGDRLTITGNYTEGTAKVYATDKNAGTLPVVCWSMEEVSPGSGTFQFINTPTPVINVTGTGNTPSFYSIPADAGGGFYFKEGTLHIAKYSATGDLLSETVHSDDFDPRLSTAVKYICKDGEDDIIAYCNYRATATSPAADKGNREFVDILRVPGGDLSLATVIASTPSLGSTLNLNGLVDIVTRIAGDDLEVIYYSAGNGLAKYVVEDFLGSTVDPPEVSLPNWSRTVAGENPPMAGEASVHLQARNIAAGVFNGKDRIFAPYSNKNLADVYVFEAGTGNYVGNLNVEGVAALGTARLSDGDVTEDGKLLLTNLARNAETFQVYKWENESAAPELIISHQLSGTARYGDKVFITGNYTTGTAKVYATNKEKKYADVKCWSMIEDTANPGTYKFNDTPNNALNVYGFGTQSTVCPIPSGGFYYKEVGMPISKYDVAGDSIGETKSGVARFHGTAIRYICKDGNDDIIAYFRFRVTKGDEADPHKDADQEYVDILRVPNGDLSEAKIIASTPSLGSAQNLNGWGDLVVRKAGDDLEVFYYAVNNGFAKCTVEDFLTLVPEEPEDPNLETVWSFSIAGGNLFTFPTGLAWSTPTAGSTARNFAVGSIDSNERIFISAKGAVPLIYNASNGAYVGLLNDTGVAGGSVALGDGDVTEDGKLILSNVARNAEVFKVYMWENETDAPQAVITHQLAGSNRYGDKLFVTGNYSTGTAKVYAANKKAGYNDILSWSMIADTENPGKYIFSSTPVSTINVFGTNTQANVTTIPGGGYYYKEVGLPLVKYNAAGDSIGASNLAIGYGTNPRFVGFDGEDEIIAYFRYWRTGANKDFPVATPEEQESRVELLRVPKGNLADAESIAMTPSLGNIFNVNGWGDVVTNRVGKDVEVYVFDAYNGLGKYVVKNVFVDPSTSVAKPLDSNLRIINRAGQISVEGPAVSTIEIYNTLGQLVRRTNNTNEVNTGNLAGVHVVKVKFNDLSVKTAKVIL